MNRHERRATARKSNAGSTGASVGTPAELYEAGLSHMRAGRLSDAKLCCQRALALDAKHVDALHLMGLLSLQARHYDDAVDWVGRANRVDPKADYLAGLGTALQQQGLLKEALKAFEDAVHVRPDDAELWTRLANILVLLQRPEQAILSFEQALELDPRYWYAANDCAVLLLKLERFEDALAKLDLCHDLRPDHAPTVQGRAGTLYQLNRFEEALREGRRAQALDPANAEICYNLGITMQKLVRHEDALEQFDQALALRPNFADALQNKALALTELHRFDEAVMVYRHLTAIAPDNADLTFQLSMLDLLTGNFEAGWVGREARWRMKAPWGSYPQFPQPLWRGDADLRGKTILVLEDEGLGDAIQFVRYVPMLVERGARVVLRVGDPLHALLSELPGVAGCSPKSIQPLPPFDLHCPICSLPLAFGTRLDTIPAATPYLPAPAESRVQAWERRLEARLGPRRGWRVGLVWSGRSSHLNDHNRSIPLQMLKRILDVDASFISLQKDPRPADKAFLEQTSIVDLTEHLTDFAETAALIGCLDLVITVDTSTAHLAGALGRPTWILLPYTPDWRWLLDRDDSPWYPTVRLFRQTETREYASVIERVRAELSAAIANQGIVASSPQLAR